MIVSWDQVNPKPTLYVVRWRVKEPQGSWQSAEHPHTKHPDDCAEAVLLHQTLPDPYNQPDRRHNL